MSNFVYFKQCPICSATLDLSNFNFQCKELTKYGNTHIIGKISEYYIDWFAIEFTTYKIGYYGGSVLSIYSSVGSWETNSKNSKKHLTTIPIKDIETWIQDLPHLEDKISKLIGLI